ncbi:MAG TPA: phosphopentomutase [Clostridia bacterium]|nr:phosphopentomutase [Clostridia bacterium]
MKKRFIIIVLDSVGIGAQPDAAEFGDEGANTLGNIYKKRGLNIPHMLALGLGNIEGAKLPRVSSPSGCFGRAAEITKAKDTTSGHWEMAGVVMDPPFRTYPDGFPQRLIDAFERRTGRGTLGNVVASGTEIIQKLGDEHVRTGRLIVYTSADSVFQVAAHQDVVPLEELYRCCEAARDMLTGDDLVGRVIARPFVGRSGAYTRTEFRRDYAIPPVGETILDALTARGMSTVCIGKIEDIFHRRGVSVSDHTRNNRDGIESTLNFIREGAGELIFTNLVDFDMLYGHRNDIEGYGAALEYFDAKLPELQAAMREGDIMLITADHGCDPTTASTDHSREYIPIVAFGPSVKGGVDLGTRRSFADIGCTAFDYLTGEPFKVGASFLSEMK